MQPLRTALLISSICLASCGGKDSASITDLVGLTTPTRTLDVLLTHDGAPVEAAHLRITAINSGPVPLPVSIDHLVEYLHATGCSTTTDHRGRATVTLYDHLPHLVEVAPPPFGPLADEKPWVWAIDPGSTEFVPIDDDPARPRAATLTVAQPSQTARK